jgi:general stress protein 26
MTLEELHDLAWSRLEAGVSDASAPARNLVLATVGPDGPEARTLVLRGADREAGTLEMHGDAASAKVAQLRADPRAAVHLWDAGASLQVRLRGEVEVISGEEADAAWERVPEGARFNYGGTPAPGEPIAAPVAHEPGAERGRFAMLRLRAREVEVLLLGERHLRAVFADGARWVAP